MGIAISSLVIEVDGYEDNQGTWVYPDIAIDLATWASVEFRIWANRTLTSLVQKKELTPIQTLAAIAQQLVEQEQRLLDQQRKQEETDRLLAEAQQEQKELIGRTDNLEQRVDSLNGANTGYTSLRRYCKENKIKLPLSVAKETGKLAAKLCKSRKIPIGSLPDEMFGAVNTYPREIVEEAIAIAKA